MWKDAENFLLEDKYLAPLVKKYGHCKLVPRSKEYYFEDLVDAIVQQQLSMKAASSIFNRLKEKSGENENINNSKRALKSNVKHKWRVYKVKSIRITPENILHLSDKDLRNCGLSKAKTVYLKDLSKRVKENKLKINLLYKLHDDEVIKELIKVKGIGEWTAHMFLMFTLGRPDIFPSGDLGLRNAFEKTIKKDLNKEKMEKFARRWKPFRTIASWYIWKSIED